MFYVVGVLEYMAATPFSQFSWPLDVNATDLIRDYQDNTLTIKPINKNVIEILRLPTFDTCTGLSTTSTSPVPL